MGKSTTSLTQEGRLEHPVLLCTQLSTLQSWPANVGTGREQGGPPETQASFLIVEEPGKL